MRSWVKETLLTLSLIAVTATVTHLVETHFLADKTPPPPGYDKITYAELIYRKLIGRPCDAGAEIRETDAQRTANYSSRRLSRRLLEAPGQVRQVPLDFATKHRCYRFAPYCDICLFEDVCHDGDMWFLIDPDAMKKNKTRDPVTYPFNDFKTGVVYPSTPIPPPAPDQVFPFNGGGFRAKRRTPEFLNTLARQYPDAVQWVDDAVPWIPAIEYPLDNTYYWTTRVLPLMAARRFNATDTYKLKFPPMDFLYVWSQQLPFGGEWHKEILAVVTGRDDIRVEYKDGKWAKEMSPAPNQPWHMEGSKWKCFKHAVMTGTFALAVPDPMMGWEFRQAIYDRHKMPLPTVPKKKALFYIRKELSGRYLVNLGDMLDVAKKYGIEYTVVAKVPSFKEQLALFADHGVIVAPHGAGLMNLVFAPPFGAVVEIFPYQTHHNLYPAVSAMMGLAHYPVHTYNGSTIIDVDEIYHKQNCSQYTAHQINWKTSLCKNAVFQRPIWVDLYAFETAFVNAMVHVGVNIDLRGVKPVRDPSTVTGWK